MEKVKCRKCGNIAYTASPGYTKCGCGGRLKTVPEIIHREDLNRIKKEFYLLVYSVLFKQLCG